MSAMSELCPLVSVLIPSFNHENFIEDVLNSFHSITYKNFEVLIIDDGSTDSSPQIIQKWVTKNKDKIRVDYYARENKGCAFTMNELINKASGDYIYPSASDDYLLPDSIENLVKISQIFKEKSYYFGDGIVVNEKNEKIYDSILEGLHSTKKNRLFTDETLAEEFICRWGLGGPLGLFRSSFLKNHLYDPSLMVEDWDLYLTVAENNQALFMDISVCAYRVHSYNTCRIRDKSKKIKNLESQLIVSQRHQKKLKGYLKDLLKKEEIFIYAKILFLKKQYLKFLLSLAYYIKFSCFLKTKYFIIRTIKKKALNNYKKIFMRTIDFIK